MNADDKCRRHAQRYLEPRRWILMILLLLLGLTRTLQLQLQQGKRLVFLHEFDDILDLWCQYVVIKLIGYLQSICQIELYVVVKVGNYTSALFYPGMGQTFPTCGIGCDVVDLLCASVSCGAAFIGVDVFDV